MERTENRWRSKTCLTGTGSGAVRQVETDTLVGRTLTGVVGHHAAGWAWACSAAVLPAGLHTVSREPANQVGVSQVAALVLFEAGGEFSQD